VFILKKSFRSCPPEENLNNIVGLNKFEV